ncbi:hypothetical protein ACN42_g10119 [Penicillium freii]|uniref:Uncharacterized protein n=1 Tax=Penicillium freii TaxID=48697 RepID=A0A101MAN0_PENFR|nr:hypothetical protein ACN42_g10119 [Penicillium freii]
MMGRLISMEIRTFIKLQAVINHLAPVISKKNIGFEPIRHEPWKVLTPNPEYTLPPAYPYCLMELGLANGLLFS